MIVYCNKDKKLLGEAKAGHMPSLVKILEENIEYYTFKCVKTKEDHELYQGYTQALLAIKEAVTPSKS